MEKSKREKDRAVKKIEIAIDKMIDLCDMGFGCDSTNRILDKLNSLKYEIEIE